MSLFVQKNFSLWLGIKIVLVCWFTLSIFVPSHKEKNAKHKIKQKRRGGKETNEQRKEETP